MEIAILFSRTEDVSDSFSNFLYSYVAANCAVPIFFFHGGRPHLQLGVLPSTQTTFIRSVIFSLQPLLLLQICWSCRSGNICIRPPLLLFQALSLPFSSLMFWYDDAVSEQHFETGHFYITQHWSKTQIFLNLCLKISDLTQQEPLNKTLFTSDLNVV